MPYGGEKFTFCPAKAKYSRVLTSWYNHFNRAHYGGRLPKLNCYWYPFRKMLTHGATMFEDGKPTRILFHKNLNIPFLGRMCLISLLHEIAHVATPRAMHGKVFKDEQERLMRKGAYRGLF
ncbi:MAG: hypothetical protein WCC95_18325 [Candidatus Sulfotelmatobacter sp.]